MGSTSSRPSNSSSASTATAPNATPTADPSPPRPRPSSTLARLNSLRRLSTLGRRDRDVDAGMSSKRGRQGSSTSDSPLLREDDKKKRFRGASPAFVSSRTAGESSSSGDRHASPGPGHDRSPMMASGAHSPPTIIESAAEDVTMEPAQTTQLSYPQPQSELPILGAPIVPPASTLAHATFPPSSALSPLPASIPLPITPPLERSDPLAEERLRSISTIRDALGHEWSNDPSSSSSTPTMDSLLSRFRRSTSFPDLSPQTTQTPRTMSDRLTALLGFATPADESSQSQPHPQLQQRTDESSDSTNQESTESAIEELAQRLERARDELLQTERELDEVRERAQAARRRPAGAVLVIQGLAQTHSQPAEEEGSHADSATGGARRPGIRHRRSSEGSTSRRSSQQEAESDRASLDTQARMIGGLLTVAAAATATTLLSPDQPPLPNPNVTNRSSTASALESIINRLRPSRPNRTQSVEAALSNYLRSTLQSTRSGQDGNTDTNTEAGSEQTPTDEANAHLSDDFQRFLEGLQGDLVGAVREFAGPLPLSTSAEDEVGEADSFVTAAEGIPTPTSTTPRTEAPPAYPQPGTSAEAGPSSGQSTSPIIPSFHNQLGQNLPTGPGLTRRTPAVSGGSDGRPRRLDFFRAHLFPSVASVGNGPAPDDDTEAMVPCLFVGVRSVRHDPNMTTEELVQHPSFPFLDGQVPPTASPVTATSPLMEGESRTAEEADFVSSLPNETAPQSTVTSPSPAASSPPERRSLRERFFDRLNPNRAPRPVVPLNTYLVYVIGGNYPRNHPVLSIPNLITGGPLTDEEMALVGELMGSAKPPTVAQEEIEKSGLRIVLGQEMVEENKKGALLDSCVERCLICLSEYEDEDPCRVLNCRHGYHKECVDHWLSTGRNSCPACRSEAVDTSKTPSTSGAPEMPVAAETVTEERAMDDEVM